ncbi:MAG: hypothetical protein KAK00_02675 [Nanoarchaeota archaeon]|nr:hypothetical protein [Nanoarchaeota archaeon]
MISNPIMEETEQFNIRLPKALLYDLEFISQHVKISRNDWIRLNLAKIIMDAKEEIIGKFEEKYVGGYLTDKEFKDFVGFNPTEGMKQLKDKKINDKKVGEQSFRNYVEKLAKGIEEKDSHFDRYMKKIINKVEKKRKKKKC